MPPKLTPTERFWAKVNLDGPVPAHAPELGACWLWTGGHGHGYGSFYFDGKRLPAHHFLMSPRPVGMEADHLCYTHNCIRPSHLEWVTHKTNMERGPNGRRTHCPQGHPYEGDNLRVAPDGRKCKVCQVAHAKTSHKRRDPMRDPNQCERCAEPRVNARFCEAHRLLHNAHGRKHQHAYPPRRRAITRDAPKEVQ